MGLNPYNRHPELKNRPVAYFVSVLIHVGLAVWLGKMAVEHMVPTGDVTSMEMEYIMPKGEQTETTEIDVIDSPASPEMTKAEPAPLPPPQPKAKAKPAPPKIKTVEPKPTPPTPKLEAPKVAEPEVPQPEGDMVVDKKAEPKPKADPIKAVKSDELPDKTDEEPIEKIDRKKMEEWPEEETLTDTDTELDAPDIPVPPVPIPPSPVTSPKGTGTKATTTDQVAPPSAKAPTGRGIPGPRNMPAKKTTSSKPFGIPNGVVLPDSVLSPYASNRPPSYPFWARMRGKEGTVVIHYIVNAKGLVEELRIVKSSGISALDQEAAKAVQKWRFKPMGKRGVYERPFTFRLRGAAKEAPTQLRRTHTND